MKILISDIIIRERQRKDLGDIDEIADSLNRIGQIHNIGVNEKNELIWGMRRLTAAKKLGWTEIEATKREGLTEEREQEIELEEDIKRKDRTWQEKCLAVAKLFRIKARAARANQDPQWSVRSMASFTGMSKSSVGYMLQVADALSAAPIDTGVWKAANYMDALGMLRDSAITETEAELNRRRPVDIVIERAKASQSVNEFASLPGKPASHVPPSSVQQLDTTSKPVALPNDPPMPENINILSLRERAELYNTVLGDVGAKNTPLYYQNRQGREFIHGFWFLGGGNISDLYGSYQVEYLRRIGVLFEDAQKVVHLFSGSLPPSDKYVRVGLPQDGNEPDIKADAHEFSSYLPFKADVIYADPPYSVEDSEHYDNAMVNRERVLSECANALTPGGYVVWLDQALPVFKNEELEFVGCISYIRSTGNRFRCVCIFRKPCLPTTSSLQSVTTKSVNLPASSPTPVPQSTGASDLPLTTY